jgi:hypothetical protein
VDPIHTALLTGFDKLSAAPNPSNLKGKRPKGNGKLLRDELRRTNVNGIFHRLDSSD